jgi:DNA-binding LytR/AlgR family response regulator
MIKTVLLDDDLNSLRAAAAALHEQKDVQVIAAFQKSRDFFDYIQEHAVELLFLDIELNHETGFEIAEQLHKQYPSVLVVFLTGHSTYAIDSYDFQPVYFLTKPISPGKMDKAMDCVRKRLRHEEEHKSPNVMLKCVKGYRIIDVDSIYYIERRGRKNFVVGDMGELQIAYYTMNELIEILGKYNFFLCHQSFIVSIPKITGIYEEGRLTYYATLSCCREHIPISRKQQKPLRELLSSVGNVKL